MGRALRWPTRPALASSTRGSAPPRPPAGHRDRESFERVIRTACARVGELAHGPERRAAVSRCGCPSSATGRDPYVVTAVVKPDGILNVIARQRVPRDWIISIFDANGLRVARSRSHEESLGGRGHQNPARPRRKPGRAGIRRDVRRSRERIYTPYSRIEPSGWPVALGIPTALVEAAGYRSLAIYGGSILLSIALGSCSRPCGSPEASRARSTSSAVPPRRSVARGAEVADTSIPEIRDVAAALVAAAEERTGVEVDREALLRKEQDARATAEAADRAKDEFLAGSSHELRTPLNAVVGWARMLAPASSGEASSPTALEAIERNANAQAQLIDDLLDVSRIITRQDAPRRPAGRPARGRRGGARRASPGREAKGVRLRRVARSATPASVTGDPDRLQQIVWNLLINAVKFTPRGGRVQVALARDVDRTSRSSSATPARASRPSSCRTSSSASARPTAPPRARTAGSVSGLAIVKHLVELHGGTVAAQSAGDAHAARPSRVTLPLTIAEFPPGPLRATCIRRRRPPSRRSAGARLDGLKILVVDDDPDALELATAILESPEQACGRASRRPRRWTCSGMASRRARLGHRDARQRTAIRSSGRCARSIQPREVARRPSR